MPRPSSYCCTFALLAGCGRLHIDVLDDALVDAPAMAPWSAPQPVVEINQALADEDDPTLTGDLLEIYFASTRAGGAGRDDIWVATRSSPTDPFNAPTNVIELNTATSETTPEITPDGLLMFFASDRPGTIGVDDCYMATRAARGDTWSAPVRVAELSTTESDESPAPTADGLTMFLDSDLGSKFFDHIYIATRADRGGAWSKPVLAPGLDTAGIERENPFPAAGGLTLWFTQTPVGSPDGEIAYATRASTAAAFGPTITVKELGTPYYEADPWVSPDGYTIFFSSTRTADSDIYFATR
jgi:WD40 repeat protein